LGDPRTMRRFARLLQPTGWQHQAAVVGGWREVMRTLWGAVETTLATPGVEPEIADQRWAARGAVLRTGARLLRKRLGRTASIAPAGAPRPSDREKAARVPCPAADSRSGPAAPAGGPSLPGAPPAPRRPPRGPRVGGMPALAALMERGAWGPLASTVPALTLPAWSSFMTGKNPGGHGVYAFHRMAFDRYDSAGLANAADLRATRIWDVAARDGKR